MNGTTRRSEILKILSGATMPVSAGKLAETLGVSRQVIVQDIALLRATGTEIQAHARGYLLAQQEETKRVFKVLHSDEDVEKELSLIVDDGGLVVDVFIYHKVYGKVKAPMNIRTRRQIKAFLEDIAIGKSSLLKNVTSGYHYHTILADSKETLDLIEEGLKNAGFLAPLQPHEPEELSCK